MVCVAALADWARLWVPAPACGGATICSKAWSLRRMFRIRLPLVDLILNVCDHHGAKVGTQLVLDEVFLVLELTPCLLVLDDGLAEVVSLVHADQGKLGLEDQVELLGLAEEGKGVIGRGRREDLVGDRDIEDTLQGIGPEADLTPGVVEGWPAGS